MQIHEEGILIHRERERITAMKKSKMRLDEKHVRVIKISKAAITEFIHEKLIDETEKLFDVDLSDVTTSFDIDYDSGELIFCAYKSEKDNDEANNLPYGIDLKRIIRLLPDTVSTLFEADRYKEYTADELIKLSKKDKAPK